MAGEAILIVDDNPVNLKLAQVLLSRRRVTRCAAPATPRKRWTCCRSFTPRLILMDIQLPGMDGLELTRRLREDPATRGVVILGLTAYAMKGDQERVLAAGCDGYIAKPIDTRKFPQLIAEYLLMKALCRGGPRGRPVSNAPSRPPGRPRRPPLQNPPSPAGIGVPCKKLQGGAFHGRRRKEGRRRASRSLRQTARQPPGRSGRVVPGAPRGGLTARRTGSPATPWTRRTFCRPFSPDSCGERSSRISRRARGATSTGRRSTPRWT